MSGTEKSLSFIFFFVPHPGKVPKDAVHSIQFYSRESKVSVHQL